MIGKTVSHYKILEKLGEGGMSIVYRAHDTKLDRFVAIKFLPSRLCCEANATERFIHEAKTASSLNHPNIGVIHEIDQIDGETFIVMAYYTAETLKERLDRGEIDISTALDIAVQIASGLAAAHDAGIVHRDIKPSNILITKDLHIEIIDFGVAKLTGLSELPADDAAVGTVAYMSPEQAQGTAVDRRADIWALGVTLYEMLTGRKPFCGDYDEVMIYSLINTDPEPVTSLRSDVSMELELIIRKAMSKRPEDRYQDLREMITDLKAIKLEFDSGIVSDSRIWAKPAPSIAVLPFRDMSSQKDQEYFCDGMAEELINAFAKIEGLRVVARTSSFQFRDREEDMRKIGALLRVNTLLEGSVRKEGNRLRITAQLINVEDGFHIWSERYDREMEDIFAVQEEIALTIVEKLKCDLLPDEKAALLRHHTRNVEAYQLYLEGRYFWSKRTSEGLRKATECFERAIEKDPAFAVAYSGLSDSYNMHVFYGLMSPREAIPKSGAAAMQALKMGEANAEACTSLAFIRMYYDHDWIKAERRYRQAIEQDSDYPTAHQWYAELLMALGRWDEALTEVNHAFDSDPLSLILFTLLGWYYYFLKEYDKAVDYLKKTLDMDENFLPPHLFLGNIYVMKSMFKEAIAQYKRGIEIFGEGTLLSALLAHAHAAAGNTFEARRLLEELLRLSGDEFVPPFYVSAAYAALGETDKAFEWLERSCVERDIWAVFLKVDPICDPLRSDPRFADLLQKAGLA